MKRYQKIILAGEDNTCETIMAEAILKQIAGDRELEIVSRGLVVLLPEPVNPHAVKVLEEHNLKPAKLYSEELQLTDLTKETLILALREAQMDKIITSMEPVCDIATLRGFVGYAGEPVKPMGDIENYHKAFEHLDLLIKAAAQKIFEPIDEERRQAEPLRPLSLAQVKKVVAQKENAAQEMEKFDKEVQKEIQALEAEYREVVEKTAVRQAAKEAAELASQRQKPQ